MMKHSIQKLAALTVGVMSALSVGAQEPTGDFVTTVADLGESGMFVGTLCPTEDVAVL